MYLVIVESPAKAKTIGGYLGKDYKVLASYGHVRNLPSKNGSVDPENDFKMLWELSEGSKKNINAIIDSAKTADAIFLATDPDREGEAISWHVYNILNDKKILKNKNVKRVVFNSITKDSITESFKNPRDIDSHLVEAYLARLSLDYLVGFNISPILWRKMPGSRSAGRVQSVALRLICEREIEIENFNPDEYWSIFANAEKKGEKKFNATLSHLNGEKLEKFTINNKEKADKAIKDLSGKNYAVDSVETKTVNRSPYPPFITSTLQQESSRRLYFSAKKTMQIAQQLYEGIKIGAESVGLITYMRTDGLYIDGGAINNIRKLIAKEHGDSYVPSSPRLYKTKSKNAQEAHEAIRPADITKTPKMMAKFLTEDQLKLYSLIYKRTLASQMSNALIEQTSVIISDSANKNIFRASGSKVAFNGFLAAYEDNKNDSEKENSDEENNQMLPKLSKGDIILLEPIEGKQHFTEAPPRYSEASLVKRLEELGIGRPSTYASIISVLQDRDYVRIESRRFFPEDRGRLVTAFLTTFFHKYLEYSFTAKLEEELDEITEGKTSFINVLNDFWKSFNSYVKSAEKLTYDEVTEKINEILGEHYVGKDKECPNCHKQSLILRSGKFGAFVACNNYPDCNYTRPVGEQISDGLNGELGKDPTTGESITIKKGPYGFYIELGEAIKRTTIPAGFKPEDISLAQAIFLVSLPKLMGKDPKTGEDITFSIGRFGPYFKRGNLFASYKGDIFSARLEDSYEPLEKQQARLKNIGTYNKNDVIIKKGRFGSYIVYKSTNIPLPKDVKADEITLEFAIERIESYKPKATKKTAKSKVATVKAKKTTTKKVAAKKVTTKASKK